MDSDVDSWVHLDSPAYSSDDDDAGVLALSSGRTTPYCLSDDEHLGVVVAISSTHRRARFPYLEDDDDDDDDEGLYDPADAEEVSQPSPLGPTKPLSGLFYHTLAGGVEYAPFDPIHCCSEKVLIPDPAFSACNDEVTVLSSTRGLVCLRGHNSGVYIVANPATYHWIRLPLHSCDHNAYGDPSVVITFEETTYTCCADHRGHYHVVVAFPLGDGIYAYESFSSRTWEWTLGAGVSTVEQVVSASGVGALGRAFWRTTLGYFLCYNPAAGTADLIPAPQEVQQWPYWEIGEMNDTLSVTCMDERVNEVVVINLHLEPLEHDSGEIVMWSLAGHFEGGRLRNCNRVQLLRSQGPEVVMWDPTLERVVATDIEGRTTRTIGPLSGRQYYSDFIPYVSSSTGITRIEAGAHCTSTAADAEAY